MNRSESKYFNTAAKMDEAFLALLEIKDFAYITVKELCAAAGVNRSTFYLHYETLEDLLGECAQYLNDRFLSYMQRDCAAFVEKLHTCPLEELCLVTPEYLTPYLTFIKENQRLFRTSLAHAGTLHLEKSYAGLLQYVLFPILERFSVPEEDRPYLMAFYISGLMAVVTSWLDTGCEDSVARITSIMQRCIPQRREGSV